MEHKKVKILDVTIQKGYKYENYWKEDVQEITIEGLNDFYFLDKSPEKSKVNWIDYKGKTVDICFDKLPNKNYTLIGLSYYDIEQKEEVMVEEDKDDDISYLLIPFVIAILIIAFIISFGKINPLKDKEKERKRQESLNSRHSRMEKFIKDKIALSELLDRKNKAIYLSVRITIFCFWGIANSILFMYVDFDTVLKYNAVAGFGLIALSFLIYGSFEAHKTFLEKIKMYIELRTYGKYKNLESEISEHKKEQKEIEKKIKKQN